MLFHNCADRNLNLDLTASLPFTLSRHTGLYKDPCKIISKFVDFDVPTESDRYIGDLSIDEDIEKEIQVDFFDNLKTPSEELKGFTPIDESNPLVSGLIAAVAAYNNSSISSTSHFDSTILSKTNSLTVPASSSTPSVSSLSSPSQSPSPSPSPNSSLVTNDIEMGDERKSSLPHHLSHLQVKQTQANNDSLMTPIIDPNSSLANNGPHFPSFDVNSDNVFGQYLQELTQSVSCENDTRHLQQQDVKPNFSLMPSTLAYSGGVRQQQQQHQQQHQHQLEQTSLSSSTPSLHHIHQNQNQTQTQSNESGLDSNRSSSHMYSLGASTQHDFEYPTTLPGISGYSNRSAVCDVEPNMGIGTPSSLTPSSSTSSMSYAELKPRSYSFSQPSTSILTESMVPTVIEDHPYTSRHNTSSPFGGQPSFSPPSSCPSNSSLNSTTDQRDCSRDLFCLINGSDFSSSSRKRNSNQHEASSRRGRLTKKEKLDKMITEEKRLESENTMLKEQLRVMEHQFKVLQTKITNILIDAAKRKG